MRSFAGVRITAAVDFAGRTYLAWLSVLQVVAPIAFVLFGADLVVHGQTSLGTLLSFTTLLMLRLLAAVNTRRPGDAVTSWVARELAAGV